LKGSSFTSSATIGSELEILFHNFDGQRTKLQVWDLPGAPCSSKPFDRIMSMQQTIGYLVCVDLSATEQEAKNTITQFQSKMKSFGKENYRRVLVGTKKDKRSPQMTTALLKSLAIQNGFEGFVETSVKDAASTSKLSNKHSNHTYQRQQCQRPFDIVVELCKRFNPLSPKKLDSNSTNWTLSDYSKFAIGIASALGISIYFAAQASSFLSTTITAATTQ